jgi:hypothetical protein
MFDKPVTPNVHTELSQDEQKTTEPDKRFTLVREASSQDCGHGRFIDPRYNG